jgi:mono/diheme cytochrome c family protein
MRKLAVIVVLLGACSSEGGARLPRSAHGDPVVEVRGALKDGRRYALGRADLEALPRTTVRGIDPASGRAGTWDGVPLLALVGQEVKKGVDTAVVWTADGGAIPIPLVVVRTLKPVLADRADGAPLPAPVLAWPTLEQRGIETDPRAVGWWTHGVVALELVDWQRTFAGALATPDGAPDAARRGAAWYGDRCIACHAMRGAGGKRGPDLTTVAARLGPGPFAARLEDHPGWTDVAGDPPGAAGVEELWSFLGAVAKAGSAAPAEPLRAEHAAPAPNAP